jgi:hypothetical protein
MTRTVAVRVARAVPWVWGGSGHPHACAFCSIRVTGGAIEHHLCPGEIKDAAGAKGSTWTCACHAAGHPATGNPALS